MQGETIFKLDEYKDLQASAFLHYIPVNYIIIKYKLELILVAGHGVWPYSLNTTKMIS